MPAPEPVSAALRLALADGGSGAPASEAPHAALLRPVDFEEAGDYRTHLTANLKNKYTVLRPEPATAPSSASSSSAAPARKMTPGEHPDDDSDCELPTPKRVLFPISSVVHGWKHGWQVGSGMQNFGNTCYLNSTLQALFHVSAFVNWLVSEKHSDKCTQNGVCIICCMKKTLVDTQNSGGPIKPYQVYTNLRSICRHLTPGRQEDAHEFLRYLVEAMEKAYLSQLDGPISHLDQYSKETTPLNQILGGYLRSVVRCLSCGGVSTTFQHFQDLLVDARKASSIDEAMETFFTRERLEDLGYKCEFCMRKVSATKQFFIERPPMVLCIALKRFSITGGKLTKHIQFKPRLSINKFMFDSKNPVQLNYRLVSIVTHLGQSQNCGHYTAAGVSPSGSFYQFDDSCVREIPVSQVLNTNAYILFYELGTSFTNGANKNNLQYSNVSTNQLLKEPREINSNFIGPVMPKGIKVHEISIKTATVVSNNENMSNGARSKPSILTLNFRSNENGGESSSKDKNFNGASHSQNSNGGLKVNCNSYNQSSYFSSNSPSSSVSNSNNNNNNNVLMISKTPSGIIKSSSNGSITSSTFTSDKNGSCSTILNGNYNNKSDGNVMRKVTNGSNNNNNKLSDRSIISVKNKTLPSRTDNSELVKLKVKSKSFNGTATGISSLVPYDSESSGENQDDDDKCKNNESLQKHSVTSTVTKATQEWKVSTVEEPESKQSPNQQKNYNRKSASETRDQPSSSEGTPKDKETVNQLQRLSHRGYGAPVSSWNGTHAQLNRQVFDDRKSELKRAANSDDDEIDRGRSKKVRYNNYNNKYHNGRNTNYNAFQESQNHVNKWGNGKNYKKFHNFNRNNYNKHKSRPQFGSHYSRYHNGGHYHNQYNRNR